VETSAVVVAAFEAETLLLVKVVYGAAAGSVLFELVVSAIYS